MKPSTKRLVNAFKRNREGYGMGRGGYGRDESGKVRMSNVRRQFKTGLRLTKMKYGSKNVRNKIAYGNGIGTAHVVGMRGSI